MSSANMADDDDINDIFTDMSLIEPDLPSVRSVCDYCRRPISTCWCKHLPKARLNVKTTVYILQHPYEETRSLRTAIMLTLGLAEGRCHTIKGKRFSQKRHPELHNIAGNPKSILLYPGENAVDLINSVPEDKIHLGSNPEDLSTEGYNLFVLDGTWLQARGMYNQNPFLQTMKQVQLTNTGLSKYVVRTQPTQSCLSTVETVALSIATLEQNPSVYEELTRPLEALCEYQLEHGAVTHHSKQYLKDNGLYVKQVNPNGTTKKSRRKNKEKDAEIVTGDCPDADCLKSNDRCDPNELMVDGYVVMHAAKSE